MLTVEVIYVPENAPPFQVRLDLPEGATIEAALAKAKLKSLYPEVAAYPVGIFSEIKPLDTVLRHKDRIEIYRPLTIDPKLKRKLKARKKSVAK